MEYRELGKEERPKVIEFYKLTTYRRPVSRDDRVFVVEDDGTIRGALRIERRDGVQVLRGMYMHPDYRRQGLGSALLNYLEPHLAESEAYCLPFHHLKQFYEQIGFRVAEQERAPAFLRERIRRYHEEGTAVLLMHRAKGWRTERCPLTL